MIASKTDYSADDIKKKSVKSPKKIVADRGFDDSPYTRVTLSTFTQLKKLTDDLLALPIQNDLKQGLTDLIPFIGDAVFESKRG